MLHSTPITKFSSRPFFLFENPAANSLTLVHSSIKTFVTFDRLLCSLRTTIQPRVTFIYYQFRAGSPLASLYPAQPTLAA